MSTTKRSGFRPAPKKFQLPALAVGGFGSLTDGTDIPPPDREPTPPPAPPTAAVVPPATASSATTNGTTHKPSAISIADANTARPSTPNNDALLSPVMSPASPGNEPGSLKRFLSRKSMNASYTNGASATSTDHLPQPPSRPESSLSFISTGGTKSKKKKSWWQKLLGASEEKAAAPHTGAAAGAAAKVGVDVNGGVQRKRTSTVLETDEPTEAPAPLAKKRGPPPPKLPELRGVSRAGKEESAFGGEDMFSNIK